jgi:hypothetical protein
VVSEPLYRSVVRFAGSRVFRLMSCSATVSPHSGASVLMWAWVRRDVAVGLTAVVFACVAWPTSPTSGGQFLTEAGFDDFARFWNDVPTALTPACALLSGAAVAFLSTRTAPDGFR